ncbi:MAG: hypothetical protein HN742_25745 [Lentisphaerae bacterium]|jgi:pyruvate-formate lyase|nr:hypothetical protein [Lentisphaerota bacterium]MBT5608018.1 hypothetical protein [Lentisphaerota bacterium]MBT7056022.1 hypothetical protein [Lentisphaerota bacterium]MBT7845304.1 hypothetical protein [Lentisphaerota bacterium]
MAASRAGTVRRQQAVSRPARSRGPKTTVPNDNAREIREKLAIAEAFTETYARHEEDHMAIREARCLAALFPALCTGIHDQDLIAGRKDHHPYAGFSIMALSTNATKQQLLAKHRCGEPITPEELMDFQAKSLFVGGYYHDHIDLMRAAEQLAEDSDLKHRILELATFWEDRETTSFLREFLTDEVLQGLGPAQVGFGYVDTFNRLACASLDFDKLLKLGLPGLAREISGYRSSAKADGRDEQFYTAMLMALDVVKDVCLHYEAEARSKAEASRDPKRREELLAMATALRNITAQPPGDLHEAIQLMWLYCLVSYMDNYGRMDVYLGDFYAKDIDEGVLTEEEASRLITALWQLIADLAGEGKLGAAAQGRIVVGGTGRRNEANADRFALAALEVSRRVRVTEPNTTLRFCEGQDAALMAKALDMIGEGCIHPALYNDAVNIPALQKTYGASPEDAEQYLPVGCGEFCLEARSLNSPNGKMNYLAALDLVLHNGWDISTGAQAGLSLGASGDFPDFDSLVRAVKQQISHTHRLLALRHGFEVQAERKHAPFLFMSILNGACIARGKSILDGGIDTMGGMIETYGLTNLADSLTAIKTLVYEREEMSLGELIYILDHDFEGFEKERQRMLRLPKFGNDIDQVDDLLVELGGFICHDVLSHAAEAGLDYYTVCSMNPGGFQFSRVTAASADGRRKGDPMPIGNAPTQGRDTSGPTALLNSMAKPLNMHGGFVQNLKLAPSMFSAANRPRLEAMLRTYFEAGGAQIMITCINQDDLQDALEHPEKHENLLVRVGGWTSRYVTLPKDIQIAILNRTLYS